MQTPTRAAATDDPQLSAQRVLSLIARELTLAAIQQGIPQEKAKEIVKYIKDTKAKVQSSIQGDVVRVTGKDRDTLQDVITNLKAKDFGIDMQFTNYRSN